MFTAVNYTKNTAGRFIAGLAFAAASVIGLAGCAGVVSSSLSKVATPPDTVAPAVVMTSPAAGATLSGNVNLTATATDNVSVASVQFKVDGAGVGAPVMGVPYAFTLNSTTLSNGNHLITSVATDGSGNSTTSASVAVKVDNTTPDTTPPVVTMTAPTPSASVSGTVTVSANATDNVSVASVQFQLDNVNVGAADTAAPFVFSWNTASVAKGTHTLRAIAKDGAGNTATSTAVSVTVNNTTTDTTPPTVSISAPASGATVSGAVSVTAAASDNIGVASVQFQLDNVNVGTLDTAAPYSFAWNTATATNAAHTLKAIAKDAAGNSTTSAAITVTVNNGTPDTTPPTVSVTAPTSGATVSGTVSVTATAADNVGVASVQFQLDGANLGGLDTTAPYSASWNSGTATNGAHTLRAIAKDAAGNATTSTTVSVTVSNAPDTTAPTVPTGLTATASSSSQINLSWTASTDNVGVTGYKIFRGGTQVGTSSTNSFQDTGLAASTAFTYTTSAFDAAGNNSAVSGSASATTLSVSASCTAGLPCALGWFEIPNTSIGGLCPSYPEIQGQSGCASIMSAWSGALVDSKRNRLIIHGGGHSDYFGNEIYAIDFNATPIAPVLVKDAAHGSALSNISTCPEAFADGSPNARHTYNGLWYLPTQDLYWMYGAGLSACGNFSDGQWTFSPTAGTWHQLSNSTHPNSGQNGSTPQFAYDSATNSIFDVEVNTGNFWQYAITSNTWANLGFISGCTTDNATSVVDPVHRLYFCVGSGDFHSVTLAAPFTSTNLASASGCSALVAAASPGFTFDPIQQKLVGYVSGNNVITYDPVANACTTQTFTGGPTTAQPVGTFGRFQYMAGLGGFVYVGSTSTNVWFLRLVSQSTAAETDFTNRCHASGVVSCEGFDAAGEYVATPGNTTGFKPASDNGVTIPSMDATTYRSGGASARFNIPAKSGSDSAGEWWQVTPTQFAANSTVYFQFAERMDSQLLNQNPADTYFKQMIWSAAGDSCDNNDFVLVNDFNEGYPLGYADCGEDPFQATVGSLLYNEMTQQLVTGSGETGYNCQHGATSPDPNCFFYPANVWATYTCELQIGTFGAPNSTITCWVSTPSSPKNTQWLYMPNHVINAGALGFFNCLSLSTYFTTRNAAVAYGQDGHSWYDEVVISSKPIAPPQAPPAAP
jgi:predicted 3-demethylubiquinone-9 3-methyltransferase (glyoxalase superfamily)